MRVLYQILVYYAIIVATFILKKHAADNPKIDNEWRTFETSKQKSAINMMQDKTTLKLSINDQLKLLSTQNDELGYRHFRFQQTYKHVPVEGAIYLMHEQNNKVKNANGKLVRNLNLNTTPSISKTKALQIALSHINATLYAWNHPTHEKLKQQIENCIDATFYPSGELVIIDLEFGEEAAKYRLAYKFDIYSVIPLKRSLTYIDAGNGEIISKIEKLNSCTNVICSGVSDYFCNESITDCPASNTLQNNVGADIQIFNSKNTENYAEISFVDNHIFLNNDPTANAVYWATQKTREYFLNVHKRNSLDGNGMPLYSWIHYEKDYNNAFWNGYWVSYGDGDNNIFSSLTAPDVVAHEIGHGITDFSADLINRDEPGALNESFSDIFGEIVERYMRGSNDWLVGADYTLSPDINSLRNMSMPNDPNALIQQPDTYLGGFWYTDFDDNGGIHYNSGVQNYWFYLLSEGGNGINDNGDKYTVNAIGIEKAADIVYRNLTIYLTPNSQYEDARKGAIQAAIDLYGEDSNEVKQVIAAWCAVGVGNFGPLFHHRLLQ